MGGVHSQMNGLVLERMVALGTPPLKRKGLEVWLASCFKKIKRKLFLVFLKGYRYEDKLGSKEIATVPQQRRQKAYWYFLTNTEESASVRNYRCSFHP
jgi:hypothetical protein